MSEATDTKACPTCEKVFPRTTKHFIPGKLPGGIGSYCRPCHGLFKKRKNGTLHRRPIFRVAGGVQEKWCRRCEQYKRLDTVHFTQKTDGYWGSYCKECTRRYKNATKERRKDAPAFYENLSPNWLDVDPECQKRITRRVRRIAHETGYGHLADDAAQFALIELFQRGPGRVKPRFSLSKFLTIELGAPGSPRREVNATTVELFENTEGESI